MLPLYQYGDLRCFEDACNTILEKKEAEHLHFVWLKCEWSTDVSRATSTVL